MNCWKTLRASRPTAQPETADANGEKAGRIGQSAAKPLDRKVGEGSTTRAYHLRPRRRYGDEARRAPGGVRSARLLPINAAG